VKIVSIIDEHTRECLGGLVDRSITGDRLIDELDRLATTGGYPAVLRCDNGPELACDAMADWAGERVGLSFIPPGEPWRNGYVESFNSRVRDECLNINIFWSLAQARVVISDWKGPLQPPPAAQLARYQAPAIYAAACTHQRTTLTTSGSVLGVRPGSNRSVSLAVKDRHAARTRTPGDKHIRLGLTLRPAVRFEPS
jgi:hypothetical protein